MVAHSSPRLDPFQNVLLEISILCLIDDSSSLPFRQRCPCVRCWQYSVVCALLKQGDDATFIRRARQIRIFGGSCLPSWRYCTFSLQQTVHHAHNSRYRKTSCPTWLKRLVDLLSALLSGKGGQSLVGWMSNAYTLGPRTGVFSFAKAHTII